MPSALGSKSAIASMLFELCKEIEKGREVHESEVLSAACLVSLTSGPEQKLFWDIFRKLAAAFLSGNTDTLNLGAGEVSLLHHFLIETRYEDIVHFRRKDPHLWNVSFHAVRHDGRWLVCNGRFDGLALITGQSGGEGVRIAGRSKQPTAEDKSIAATLEDIRTGFHASATGRTPAVKVIFNNSRPIDQSVALARFSRVAEDVPLSPRIKVYQNRGTAFFDPAIFPAIASLGTVEFYALNNCDLRTEAVREGASTVEAFYLPDNGWAEQNAALYRLKASIPRTSSGVTGRPPDSLRLFVSLEFEKRVWTEQTEALLALFSTLRNRAREITVLVNGMTGVIFDSETAAIMRQYANVTKQEKEIIEYWTARMGNGFIVEHLAGADLVQKVSRIASCNFFTAPGGTAALLALLADVPGVYYSHPELHRHFAGMLGGFPKGRLICQSSSIADRSVRGMFDYAWAGVGGESYSIPVDSFLRETLTALDSNLNQP